MLLSVSAKKKLAVQRSQEVVRGRLLLRNYTQVGGGYLARWVCLSCLLVAVSWFCASAWQPPGCLSTSVGLPRALLTLALTHIWLHRRLPVQASVAANYDYNIRSEQVGGWHECHGLHGRTRAF